jgi:hypothetical protein
MWSGYVDTLVEAVALPSGPFLDRGKVVRLRPFCRLVKDAGMDVRRKTFADEVADAFSALRDLGFGAPTFRDESSGRTVLFAIQESAFCRQSLTRARPCARGKVTTALQSVDGRRELGPDTTRRTPATR